MIEATSLSFWLLAAAMAGLALAFVLPRLLAGRGRESARSRRALALDVYRGQLADLDRERDEGALDEADYQRARTELERRLIDEQPHEEERARPVAAMKTAWLLAGTLPLAAVLLYFAFGTPSALGPAAEVAAAEDPAGYRASLAHHLERHPADARSWVLLARADFEADRFADAAAAYDRAITLSPKVARDPEVLCELADAIGMTQGGSLAGRPQQLILQALTIDARHPRALEMAGSAAYDRGDYAEAARTWRELLGELAPGTRQHAELAAAIDRTERLARSLPNASQSPGVPSRRP